MYKVSTRRRKRNHVRRSSACEAVNITPPRFEGSPAFLKISMTVVDGSDASDRARDVVQDPVDYARSDVQPGHASCGGSPEVVEDPAPT